MSPMKSAILRVPGASLYYEVQGSGPILLLIHGGGGDARAFNGIVKHLANRYTVVTYDRRGLSRSTLDDPQEEQRVESHSDDAHHLLKELLQYPDTDQRKRENLVPLPMPADTRNSTKTMPNTSSDFAPGTDLEPAYVFGSSGGAIIGLDLVARYPDQIRTLIAHEPPSHLLSGLEERHDSIREIARRDGATSAMQQFMAQIGVSYEDREPDAELPQQRERPLENTMFLIKREFAMYERYQFDFAALRAASTRIMVAAGLSGREYVGYQNAVAMADRLGTAIVEFPGHHVGYVSHPRAFAERLCNILGDAQQ